VAGEFSAGADDLERVARALGAEENGTKLRRDLAAQLRKAVDPAIADARSALMSWGTSGIDHAGEPLRQAISGQMTAQARLTGQATGVRVRVKKIQDRNFPNAPRRANRKKGWRHPVFGNREKWVQQFGPIGWFDDSMQHSAPAATAAVKQVIADTAERIKAGS
jgi:hypothetical protein